MLIMMTPDASKQDVDTVAGHARSGGGGVHVARGGGRTVVALSPGSACPSPERLPGVLAVVRTTSPYPLVSREGRAGRSTVYVSGVPIGPDTVTVIAGPCAVETPEQTLEAARMARAAGATLLRGGAFKPRSSPYAFQGLGERGLRILAEVRAETGLPVVTEVMDVRQVELAAGYADMLQIGARNMQNFDLLRAVGATRRPVLLKRGLSATIEEWLLAAEYVAAAGNLDIVLCERGIRTYEQATRNTLDIAAVPVVQHLSHLPVVVDPSHASGRRHLVLPLTRAAIAVGADGVIVDLHPTPATARCDADQALTHGDLAELTRAVRETSLVTRRTPAPAYQPQPSGRQPVPAGLN